MRESSERAFKEYGELLGNVTAFRYLERVFTAGENDWLAVVGNLRKPRKSWGRLSWILRLEGAHLKVLGHFYIAVAQSVLLFGAETWVLTPRMEQDIDSFQQRVAGRITKSQPRRRRDEISTYP